jgi:single-strand DNA-binding protein
MASVNKVILIGNAGRDPELRYMASGQAVTNLTIATSTKRKDKVSGQMLEDTQWHRVTFYDKLAEIAGEYVKKGRPVYVEGRLKYGVYTDKTSGVEKNTVDIVATELQLLGGREEGSKRQEEGGNAAATHYPKMPSSNPKYPVAQGGKGGFEDMDSDIPFADPMKSRAFCLSI